MDPKEKTPSESKAEDNKGEAEGDDNDNEGDDIDPLTWNTGTSSPHEFEDTHFNKPTYCEFGSFFPFCNRFPFHLVHF
jgi:hypothetical protein